MMIKKFSIYQEQARKKKAEKRFYIIYTYINTNIFTYITYTHTYTLLTHNHITFRYKWDAYIVPSGTNGASCIPPTFVRPSPPANYIWASCLTHGIDNPDNNK